MKPQATKEPDIMSGPRPAVFVLALALLAACAAPEPIGAPIADIEQIASELEQLLDPTLGHDQIPDSPASANVPPPIEIPRDAPWLGDVQSYNYALPPMDAIAELLPGRSIRYDLSRPIPDIVIVAPPGPRTLFEHLDNVTGQSDWIWTYRDGVIVVTDTLARAYAVSAPPGSQNASIPMRALHQEQGAGGLWGAGNAAFGTPTGGSALGSAEDEPENNFDMELDAWQSLSELISLATGIQPAQPPSPVNLNIFDPPPILTGGDGGTPSFVLLPEANMVYVTAAPSIHERVAAVIADFNLSLNARVLLTITVYEIDFSDRATRSFDLRLLREAATLADLEIEGTTFDLSDANGLSLRLDTFEGNAYDASNLLLTLLNTQGQTSIRLHERFEIVNNIPVSISDQRSTPYVARVSTANAIGGAVSQLSTEVETISINTGIALNVLASIANDTVNVRLGYSQADLVRLTPYSVGPDAAAIVGNLPVTDSSHRLFRMSLADGATRLVANVTQTEISDRESNNVFGLFGGSRSLEQSQRQTIIAVTAQIL